MGRGRKCGPILRKASSRNMGISKDAGQEPRGPSSPGTSNELIHQWVLNWEMTGPGVSFRAINLATVRWTKGLRLSQEKPWS